MHIAVYTKKIAGFMRGLTVMVALVSIASADLSSIASAAPLTWASSPVPPPASGQESLTAISCPSTTFCLAVGFDTSNSTPAAATFDGSSWTQLDTSSLAGSTLNGVSCVTSNYCVAVGLGSTYIYSNGSWTLSQSRSGNDYSHMLLSVSCTSTSFCVAAGASDLLMYDGTSWTDASWTNPGDAYFHGVSCTSATTCVAVGFSHPQQTVLSLVETFDGTNWTQATSPNPGTSYQGSTLSAFASVSCVSATSCVAVGQYTTTTGIRTLSAKLSNGAWVDNSPAAFGTYSFLSSVSCANASLCAGGGYYQTNNVIEAVVASYDGTSWTVQAGPAGPSGTQYAEVLGMSCNPGSVCIGVGTMSSGATYQPYAIISNGPAPAAPTGLTAASPTMKPLLNWPAVSGATSYKIYRDGIHIGTSSTATYTDTTAANGTHSYYATAVNTGGESAPGNTISVLVDTVRPTVTFTAPSSFTGPFSPGPTVTVTASDTGSGLQNLVIHVYNSANQLLNICGSANPTQLAAGSMSCDLSTLASGTYSIKAGSFDNAGNNKTINSGSFVIN